MAAFLLPSRNSMVRYCTDWKPDAVAEHERNCRYSTA
jgi:hypothetical protein